MKKIIITGIICILTLAACFSPMGAEMGKNATFSITIGSGNRVALSWDPFTETSTLEHTITLTNGPGPDIKKKNVKEGQPVPFTVASGYWDITVKAYLGDVLKAEGFRNVYIKPGRNGAIQITMEEPKNETFSVITIKEIGGIAVPVTGGIPAASITPNEQYSGTVTWLPPVTNMFAAGIEYIATITLKARTGYTLTGVEENFFTVEGATTVSNNADSGVVTAKFPTTAGTAEHPATIDIAEINGITAPVIGGIPATSITETVQYTGTVIWSPAVSDTFADGTEYIATITLIAKTGYTFHGVSANFFRVAGANVSNAANSGIVTAEFPATPKVINYVAVNIVPPVKDAVSNLMATGNDSSGEGDFILSPVTWSPNDNPFLGGEVYTAQVTLTAKSGCIFTESITAEINGEDAVILSSTESTVTLSYTFPATNTKTVTAITLKSRPTKLIYTHGEYLDLAGLVVTLTYADNKTEDVAAADFVANNIGVNPAHDIILVHITHDKHPVTITYGGLTVNAGNLTVNKAPGAAVGTLTLNTKTHDSVTINPVSAPDNGQSVEYGYSASPNVMPSEWHNRLAFINLNTGTTYWFFARSSGNSNFEPGTPSSLSVTTQQTVPKDKIEYYWVDQHDSLVTTSDGVVTVNAGDTLTITAQGTGYVVKHWYLDGVNTGQTGNTFNFSSLDVGNHNVSLFVEKNGRIYNTNITIEVE